MAKENIQNIALNAIEVKDEIFRLLVDAVEDYAIFIIDPQGTILTWNKGAERLKGYTADEIIGKNIKIFYTPDNIKNNHPDHELKTAESEGRYEEEGWRLRKDGKSFWANIILTKLVDKKGKFIGFSKISRDLTERKQAEEALKNSNVTLEVKLEQRAHDLAEAIKVKDQFLSIASHELNTPLTNLKMQTQIRMRRINNPNYELTKDIYRKFLNDDLRQVERLVRLVGDMLEISRINSGKLVLKKTKFDFNDLVEEVTTKFSPIFENAKNTISLHLSAEALEGNWDAFRLEQIFNNLFTNASKYGPGKPITITTEKKGMIAVLKITDEGLGIHKEDLERIFDQFERAISASEVSGMGLGLYIAREIAHIHGGTIRAESTLNQGSTFIVELPMESR